MRVNPQYNAVGTFFSDKHIFIVPIYQRSYAWEKQEIDDFLKDLEKVFNARKANLPKTHFLGSIITVEHHLQGVVGKHNHELVDGQQRLTTFVLLASVICEQLNCIIGITTSLNDNTNKEVAQERLKHLSNRFIEFRQEVNRQFYPQRVLTLSKSDNDFFVELLRGNNPITQRDSHKRLQSAYKDISERVTRLTENIDIAIYLDNLEFLMQCIDVDFMILCIVTHEKKEAYSMFQVLNDRGKGLTEGELIRTKALELLENYSTDQTVVETIWDDILKDKPTQTDDYLRWIYASYTGTRPGTNTLFDDFLNEFYPESKISTILSTNATEIHRQTLNLKKEIENARMLRQGEWIFEFKQPITEWDRNRLKLLTVELKNENSMPLLLAAAKLEHTKFAEIVSLVEKMMFRYTIMCGQHHSPLTNVYETEAYKIRQNPSGYNINDLRKKLQDLLNNKADDRTFSVALDNLTYKKNGVSTKPLKYFLITLEDYWRWYHEDGATGKPKCKDTSKWCRFSDTTIEHIYPDNASSATYDANAEDLKNTIGNLTLLGGLDNSSIGNQPFAQKRLMFRNTDIPMNNEVANETSWGKTEILQRTNKLKEMALKIFKMI